MDHIQTPKVENVRMADRYNSKNNVSGTLYLTATHLIFVDPDANKEFWILHSHIANVDKPPISASGSPLLVRCKTFNSVTFIIPKDRDCINIFRSLQKLSQPTRMEDLYCFHYTMTSEALSKSDGWDEFSLEMDFARMGVPSNEWVHCDLNETYELCDTYPKHIYVPSMASEEMLLGSAKFRSRGRLPVLTYLHSNKAAICRCSQPLSGFKARCPEDEQLFDAIRKTNPHSNTMYVIDTRPMINAIANRAAGKGYENEAFYDNTKFHFLGIDNIHTMRTSLQKLVEMSEQKTRSMNGFLSALESSGWLKHIRAILETSGFIANAVAGQISVTVHCSDGWDRTAQVCSVAALLLDPYYRTIRGYQALIEKDWLAFGHKFTERYGHLAADPKEVSPVFTQFLDATWQLMQQRIEAFEFNEKFLLTLHDHVQSCQFGTFVGNSEKERLELNVRRRTFSLWGYMALHHSEFLNPLYEKPNPETTTTLLKPNLAPQNIVFWRGMYNRFESGVHPRESLMEVLQKSRDHCTLLEDHISVLKKQIERVKAAGGAAKEPLVGLKSPSELPSGVLKDIFSVAVEWKSPRDAKTCPCSTPFDHLNKKNYCWRCGEIFCPRCIDKSVILPGHSAKRPVPVCRNCFKTLNQTA